MVFSIIIIFTLLRQEIGNIYSFCYWSNAMLLDKS